MAANTKGISETLLDVRAVARNVKKGYLNETQVQGYLDSLPDAVAKMEPLALDINAELKARDKRRAEREQRYARFDAVRPPVVVPNENDVE